MKPATVHRRYESDGKERGYSAGWVIVEPSRGLDVLCGRGGVRNS